MTTRIEAFRNLGPIGFANEFIRRRLKPTKSYVLRSRYLRHPVWVRPNTSDLFVFYQIFRHREYRCLDSVKDARLIIDCGANVGYSAVYFLSRFPHARLVAIEPDPGNFAALQRNLVPYGARVTAVNTAIWSHPTWLSLSAESSGHGREWGRTVREASPGEPGAFEATDIASIFASACAERISILKIDVEGTERQIFSVPTPWMSRVDNLVIELHGKDCEAAFFAAIADQSFRVESCDELTVCRRSG
jgi:FkbM family methyltransferase